MHTGIEVEIVRFDDGVLSVKCSGAFGIGSNGHASTGKLTHVIEHWRKAHPTQRVCRLVIDYSLVDYQWGDGPISAILPFIESGIDEVRLLASRENRESLERLVSECALPWFEVIGPDL